MQQFRSTRVQWGAISAASKPRFTYAYKAAAVRAGDNAGAIDSRKIKAAKTAMTPPPVTNAHVHRNVLRNGGPFM